MNIWDWQYRLDQQGLDLKKYYYAVGLQLYNLEILTEDSELKYRSKEDYIKNYLYTTYGYRGI